MIGATTAAASARTSSWSGRVLWKASYQCSLPGVSAGTPIHRESRSASASALRRCGDVAGCRRRSEPELDRLRRRDRAAGRPLGREPLLAQGRLQLGRELVADRDLDRRRGGADGLQQRLAGAEEAGG